MNENEIIFGQSQIRDYEKWEPSKIILNEPGSIEISKSENAYKEWQQHKINDFKLIKILMECNRELIEANKRLENEVFEISMGEDL